MKNLHEVPQSGCIGIPFWRICLKIENWRRRNSIRLHCWWKIITITWSNYNFAFYWLWQLKCRERLSAIMFNLTILMYLFLKQQISQCLMTYLPRWYLNKFHFYYQVVCSIVYIAYHHLAFKELYAQTNSK